MKDRIRHARKQQERTGRLADEANEARDRVDEYEAQGEGPEMTSDSRLRRLQQESELAGDRLKRAQTPPTDHPADPEPAQDDYEDDDPDSGEGGTPAQLL